MNTPVVLAEPEKAEVGDKEVEGEAEDGAETTKTETTGLVTPPPEEVEVEAGEEEKAAARVGESLQERVVKKDELTLEMMTPPPEEVTEAEAEVGPGGVVSPPESVTGSTGTSGSIKGKKKKGKRKGNVVEPVS